MASTVLYNADRLATPSISLPNPDSITRFPVSVFLHLREQITRSMT
jgi:hypothetical protein